MTTQELSAKTVIELRKIAKANGIVLGAGVSKSDIVEKIAAALPEEPAPAPEQPEPAPEAEKPAAQPQTQYKAAWHNTAAPRYNSKPAYQAPAYQARPQWQAPERRPAMEVQRTAPVRQSGYTPRFGPGASDPAPQQEDHRPYRQEPSRFGPAAQERRPAYQERMQNDYTQPRTYEPSQGYSRQPAYSSSGYANRSFTPRPAYQQPREQQPYYPQQEAAPGYNASVSELLAAGECGEGSGILEIHPDGYGFLRSEQFLPSSRDIYVSMAQIRRFSLRSGDMVVGKTRPKRDNDKYTAMLLIEEVNGQPADEMALRPVFDELTPIYPTRRIDLESPSEAGMDDMRLVDIIAPLGFGQRGLILCPPDTGKTVLLQHFANAIAANHPEAVVMVLLIDVNPEDVTLFRDAVHCQVLASTFDQAPENHLRLTDLVQERAQRLVEQGKDVVLIVDSLTRLAKVYTSSVAQQGRSMPGMVNPASLFKTKRLFGAARSLKEGGSLTVIGAMNIETGSKVDDSVVEEFKGTANMELVLSGPLATTGIIPPIDLQRSGTKRAEMILTPEQQEGFRLVRNVISSMDSRQAIPQFLSMISKTDSNEAFLSKFKDWVAMMQKSR